jgi:hypothetical protein
VRDLFFVDSANNETGNAETRDSRLSSALVGEGAIVESGNLTTEQVICDALHLALVATHLRVVDERQLSDPFGFVFTQNWLAQSSPRSASAGQH